MSLYALDIETVCDTEGCPGRGGYKKCKHALQPAAGKVTVAAVWSPGKKQVFRNLSELKGWIKDSPEAQFVGHNFKFDVTFLEHNGVPVLNRWIHCTQLMAFLHGEKITSAWMQSYNATRPRSSRPGSLHSLKTLAPYFLGVEPHWEVDDKDDDDYVLRDAEYTWHLCKYFLGNMSDEESRFYFERLLPWTKMLAKVEIEGICVDECALKDKKAELWDSFNEAEVSARNKLKEAEKEMLKDMELGLFEKYDKMARARGHRSIEDSAHYIKLFRNAQKKMPKSVNLSSPTQLADLIKNYLKLPIVDLKGKEGVGIEVLKPLEDRHPAIPSLIRFRQGQKLHQYCEQYAELCRHGRVFARYNPTGTRTGRLSSELPNLQQVNKELKHLFIAESGNKLVGADLSGIEGVVIAALSECPTLTEIIDNRWSIHDYNTRVIFPELADVPLKEIRGSFPKERYLAKQIGFSIFYGAGVTRVLRSFEANGYDISYGMAKSIVSEYRRKYQAVTDYHRRVTSKFEDGQTLYNLFGRPIKIQNPDEAYMKGFNTLVQSSASDLNLFWASEVLDHFPESSLRLLVHDFICFEVEASRARELERLLHNILERIPFPGEFTVNPLRAESFTGDSWGEDT